MEPEAGNANDIYMEGGLDDSVEAIRSDDGGGGAGAAGAREAGGSSDAVEERLGSDYTKKEKAKEARAKRRKKREKELERIATTSHQDDDEIQQIMSQADKDREGAFCTGLLTACFLLHFLAEVGGLTMNGPIYSMQSVLSEHFENRIINLPEYAENQKRLELLYQNGSARVDLEGSDYRLYHNSTSHLYGMMTIKDVTKVEHLPTFARFVLDLVYPKQRESSEASAYFSHHPPTAAEDDDAGRRRL